MRARLLLALLAVLVSTPRAQDTERIDPERLTAQVERALDAPPRNYEWLLAPRQTGVRVLSVNIRATPSGELITVDLSQRALTYEPSGNIEPLLDTIIQATVSAIGAKQRLDFSSQQCGRPDGHQNVVRRDERARWRERPSRAGHQHARGLCNPSALRRELDRSRVARVQWL
jgi:hypothetical protein